MFLLRLAALALDVDEAFFYDKVDRSIGTMRLNYYPTQAGAPRPGQLRASAHTDYGGFTIFSGEDVPGGLQVRARRGRWIDVRFLQPPLLRRADRVPSLAGTGEILARARRRVPRREVGKDGADRRTRRRLTSDCGISTLSYQGFFALCSTYSSIHVRH